MGNCCSGGKEEKKSSAFQSSDDSDALQIADTSSGPLPPGSTGLPLSSDGLVDSSHGLAPSSSTGALSSSHDATAATSSQHQHPHQQQQQQGDEAQLKELREEQSRLDLIVQMAGRGMVSVRSTRGSTGYYDQGFAAALGQHLEQTTKFPDQLPIRLPSPATTTTNSNKKTNNNNPTTSTTTTSSNKNATASATSNSTVFQRLSQPQWENIALGKKGIGLAGCDGENPNTYMDHVAGSFLDAVVPKKERIFHGGVGPMVENLL